MNAEDEIRDIRSLLLSALQRIEALSFEERRLRQKVEAQEKELWALRARLGTQKQSN